MSDRTLTIRIGKGAITIDRKALRQIGEKRISIKVQEIQGPCTDESCQIIKKLVVEVGDKIEVDGLEPVYGQGISIYLDPQVFTSIDKGRQENIVLGTSMQGFHLKGFSFVT
ncbi:MAG: hypothetical protein ACP5OC_03300 [Thermoplasmata archaeon]